MQRVSLYVPPPTLHLRFFYADSLFTLSASGDTSILALKLSACAHFQILPEDHCIRYQRDKWIELFDEAQRIRNVTPFREGEETQLHIMIKQMPLTKEAQITNKQIGNIIGYGLYRFEYLKSQEISMCRRKGATVRQKALQQRNVDSYLIAPNLVEGEVPVPLLLKLHHMKRTIIARIHVRESTSVKTIAISVDSTPSDLIRIFLSKNRLNLPVFSPTNGRASPLFDDLSTMSMSAPALDQDKPAQTVNSPSISQYLLKVVGRFDYLISNEPLLKQAYILECVQQDEKINLCLVGRGDLDAIIEKEQSWLDHKLRFENSTQAFEEVEVEPFVTGTHAQLTVFGHNQNADQPTMHTMSLWDLDQPLSVYISAVENLNFVGYDSLFVEVGLYLGGEPLCAIKHTHYAKSVESTLVESIDSLQLATSSDSTHVKWKCWTKLDILMYNIPRCARLAFTVFGNPATPSTRKRTSSVGALSVPQVNTASATPLGSVTMTIMDYKGYLKTGELSLPLLLNDKANPIGECTTRRVEAVDSVLHVKLESYPAPVVFPDDLLPNSDVGVETAMKSVEQTEMSELEWSKLQALITADPLSKMDSDSSSLVWKHRSIVISQPLALPKVLLACPWHIMDEVLQAHKLLQLCHPLPAEDALELLDANFGDPVVRNYAVTRLEELNDGTLLDFLLQMCQALKFESYLENALSTFLLRRALRNRIVGHHFFWYLKSQVKENSSSQNYALLLENYLRACGPFMMQSITSQCTVLGILERAALDIKKVKNAERTETLLRSLSSASYPPSFTLALNPRLEFRGVQVDKSRFMDSKKLPLWIVVQNVDQAAPDIPVMFKHGDDLRQDMLTLQMLRIMDRLWQQNHLDFKLSPYGCVCTGEEVGMIEIVRNAETVSKVQVASGGSTAAFRDQPLDEWIRKQNPEDRDYEKALDTFALSCAGYCVATYVLGIGDRHNDNIMLTKHGHLFHIDFGHFLGNIKRKFGIKRERAPFVLTPDFVYVIHRRGPEQFRLFVEYCVTAYSILRKKANMLMNLFAMMLSTGIPELRTASDIHYLRDALCLGLSEEEAAREFRSLIAESVKMGWSTQLNWYIHNVAHR